MHPDTIQVAVSSNGAVRLESPVIHRTLCEVNLKAFPYDSQQCDLELTPRGPFVFRPSFAGNAAVSPQWEVVNISQMAFTQPDPMANIDFSFLVVSIELKRLPNFYLRNIMCPLVLLNVLALSIFFIPLKSGERISACLSLVLGVTVFQIVVADIMPKTSLPGEEPKIIGYGVSSFILLVSITIQSILATNISFKTWKITSPLARRFLLDFLPKLTLMQKATQGGGEF